jgi:hypothetical protein
MAHNWTAGANTPSMALHSQVSMSKIPESKPRLWIRIGSGFNDFVDPGSRGRKKKKKCTF